MLVDQVWKSTRLEGHNEFLLHLWPSSLVLEQGEILDLWLRVLPERLQLKVPQSIEVHELNDLSL